MRKKFDAVAFQRKARQKISREFMKDRKSFLQKLRARHIISSLAKT